MPRAGNLANGVIYHLHQAGSPIHPLSGQAAPTSLGVLGARKVWVVVVERSRQAKSIDSPMPDERLFPDHLEPRCNPYADLMARDWMRYLVD